MIVSLALLTWLAVTACAVAVCQLAADDRRARAQRAEEAPEEGACEVWEADAQDVWEEAPEPALASVCSSPRPHCESRAHRSNVKLRMRLWASQTRVGRAGARRCRQATPVCEHARRAV